MRMCWWTAYDCRSGQVPQDVMEIRNTETSAKFVLEGEGIARDETGGWERCNQWCC